MVLICVFKNAKNKNKLVIGILNEKWG